MDNLKSPSQINVLPPGNPDYDYWNSRSANLRMKGNPIQIIPVNSIEELTTSLQQTVKKNTAWPFVAVATAWRIL